jgi:hypothetical protein
MTVETSFSAVSEYLGEINKALDQANDNKGLALLLAKNMFGEYFKEVMTAIVEMDNLHMEICSILDDFTGRPVGFIKVVTIERLIINIKFYVMSWSTLTDTVASLINKVFNLGIAETDVQFGMISRNKHVQESPLPPIFKKYLKAVQIDQFNKHRNEIVHRGRILDKEVLSLKREQDVLFSRKYSLLQPASISDDDYTAQNAALNRKLIDLAAQKQSYYGTHYDHTLEFISEVLIEAARKTLDLYKRNAI